MSKNKTALIILDGWGIGKNDDTNAIFKANTPFFDKMMKAYPNAKLLTHGEHVGLPEGQMGNSEVGHMNIGAGRVVYQDLVRINKAIEDGSFFTNHVLNKAMDRLKDTGKSLHLMGLVSEGGVHSSQEHLYALCEMAAKKQVDKVFIHVFTDGRDTDPKRAASYIEKLERKISNTTGEIVSVIGRYYAMDRDKRWERIKKAYDLMVHGKGDTFDTAKEAISSSYANGISDEFIEPKLVGSNIEESRIYDGDSVICFNFRTDRCRQITMALTQHEFPDYQMKPLDLHYVTMTNYDQSFMGVNVVFEKPNLKKTLGEVISLSGLKQVRIAETEKYPHVTFFFSGGREQEFDGEKRILVNSPKVATYDLQPEMSAPEVTRKICQEMSANEPEFICLNIANPDMVGHTGDFEAIVKACEATDAALKQVVETGDSLGYNFIIIADHGNADQARNADLSANTAHSTNPVPIIVKAYNVKAVKDGILADIAPTILALLNLSQPSDMTGKSLV